MSHIRTSLPIPTQPWETAKAKFLDGLSAEEVSRYQVATIEDMFYKSDVIHKKYAQESKTCRLQERISSLVDAISDYSKALDVYVNSYGLILSPAMGQYACYPTCESFPTNLCHVYQFSMLYDR
jgi:hypothetical protein